MLTNSPTDAPINRSEYQFCIILWLIMGIILILVNVLLVINLLRHRILRTKKEYVLLAGLAMSDLLLGIATVANAAYQLVIMNKGQENEQVKQSSCVRTPQFSITAFSGPVEAAMLFVLSFDRLLAVFLPLKYTTFTRKYAITTVGVCYAFGAVYVIFLHLYTLILKDTDPTINAICSLPKMNRIYGSTYYVRMSFAVASVVVYILVAIQFMRHRRRLASDFPSLKSRLRSAQRRLTVTVGICALLTFCLYIVPTLLAAVHPTASIWAHVGWALINLNAMLNAIVYSFRHKDIRNGLKQLVFCKEMPSIAEQRLREGSQTSKSATGRAAMLIICSLGYSRSRRATSAITTTSAISAIS